MGITYEWDETKRRANLAKHGLDFADAWRVHEAPGRMTGLAKAAGGEERRQDLARVGGQVLTLIYVERAGRVRCISFRPASRQDRRIYRDYEQA